MLQNDSSSFVVWKFAIRHSCFFIVSCRIEFDKWPNLEGNVELDSFHYEIQRNPGIKPKCCICCFLCETVCCAPLQPPPGEKSRHRGLRGREGGREGEREREREREGNKAWPKAELDQQTVTVFLRITRLDGHKVHSACTNNNRVRPLQRGILPSLASRSHGCRLTAGSRRSRLAQGHFSSAKCSGTHEWGAQLVHSIVTWRPLLCFLFCFSQSSLTPQTAPPSSYGIYLTKVTTPALMFIDSIKKKTLLFFPLFYSLLLFFFNIAHTNLQIDSFY